MQVPPEEADDDDDLLELELLTSLVCAKKS